GGKAMDRRFRWGAVFAAALLAVVVGVASYNAGVSHGLAVAAPAAAAAAQGQVPAPGAPGVPMMPYYYGYRPWGFRPWGFGFFPFGLLFIFFWFALFRLAFGWGWRRRYYGGGPYCGSSGGPAGFD